MSDVHVVRNVRIPLELDTEIRRISEREDRTISKTIKRLLEYAVKDYKSKNDLSLDLPFETRLPPPQLY